MGSLVIILLKSYNIQKVACTKDSCHQTILYGAFPQWFSNTHCSIAQ